MKDEQIFAEEKLAETLYFLLQMRQNYVDKDRFIYNMNAFLCAARSVTFALQAQFMCNPKFKQWYVKKREEMKQDSLMYFFKDTRNVSVHERNSAHGFSVKIAYLIPKNKLFEMPTISYSERKITAAEKNEFKSLGIVFPSETGKPTIVEPAYTLVTSWEFEKAPDGYEGKDILALSITYFSKLKAIVEEAKQVRFSNVVIPSLMLVEVYGSLLNPDERKKIKGTMVEKGKVERKKWKLSFDKKSFSRHEAVLNFLPTNDSMNVYYTTVYEVDERTYEEIMIREMGQSNVEKWKHGAPVRFNSYRPLSLESKFGPTCMFIIPQTERMRTPTNWEAEYVATVRKGIEESFKNMPMEKGVNLEVLKEAVEESSQQSG